jgi:ribonuclease BN (tRNA processing enzyme)
VHLTVVGCSGSTSGPSSPASSYLVQAPHEGRTFSLVLDLGPGAFGHLYHHLDPREVDAIGLSHLHPDHCLDVCGFYVAARYSDPADPWPPIPLFGPAGTAERIGSAYRVAGTPGEAGPGIGDHFRYRDWGPEQQVGPFRVTTAEVAHPVPAYAIRVSEDGPDGATLVYSGDTGPCDALVDLARGADLLLAEAAFRDGEPHPAGVHLTGRQAATAAQQAGVGELVLTHIPPWHVPEEVRAEAAPHFGGPVSLATAGLRRPVRRADGPVGAGP